MVGRPQGEFHQPGSNRRQKPYQLILNKELNGSLVVNVRELKVKVETQECLHSTDLESMIIKMGQLECPWEKSPRS